MADGNTERGASSDAEVVQLLSDRLSAQSSDHWRDIALIVIGANTLAVLTSGAAIATGDRPVGLTVLLSLMLIASALSYLLAYTSSVVAATLVVGPLSPVDVATSVVVLAAQLALPLWVGSIANRAESKSIEGFVQGGRHWLAFAALFAFAAAIQISHGNQRRDSDLGSESFLVDYTQAQSTDRLAAMVTGCVLSVGWVASLLVTSTVTTLT